MEKDMPNKTATKKTVKTAKTAKRPFAAKKAVAGKKPQVRKPAVKKPVKKPVARKPVAPTPHTPPQAPVAAPTTHVGTAPTAPQAPQPTEAEKIWSEIRNRPIDMFGLPNQTVEQHATPQYIDPNKLFLVTRSSAVLPSLEIACKEFTFELAGRFVLVSRQVAPAVPVNFPPHIAGQPVLNRR
jgi:hypothetical protein